MKPEIIAAQKERPKIDRKFAELKRFHGLREARYWVAIQFTLIAIACNLKRSYFIEAVLNLPGLGIFNKG